MPVSSTIVAALPVVVDQHAAERNDSYARFRDLIADFEEPTRPGLEDVRDVAARFQRLTAFSAGQDVLAADGCGLEIAEGITHRLRFSPGVLRRRSFDAVKAEAAKERAKIAETIKAEQHAAKYLHVNSNQGTGDGVGAGVIKVWSSRSRTRLTETIASLDYSDWDTDTGDLAMVTLTLPGDWQAVAPSGKDFKRSIEKFRMKWLRDTGLPWRVLWKLEFQRRGAPHWHALMRVPVLVGGEIFTEWLSRAWTTVVAPSPWVDRWVKRFGSSEATRHVAAGTGVDFSGQDFSDPRRISLYFLGHSTKTADGKEYQHLVPEEWQSDGNGPGRFWGYCGFGKAVVEIDVTPEDKILIDRVLRKVKRARDWKMNVQRVRGAQARAGVQESDRTSAAFIGHRSPERHEKRPGRTGRAAHRTLNRRMRETAEAQRVNPLEKFEWIDRPRPGYAPFSRGQGGFVLVNDALTLGLQLAAWLYELGIAKRASFEVKPHPVPEPGQEPQRPAWDARAFSDEMKRAGSCPYHQLAGQYCPCDLG